MLIFCNYLKFFIKIFLCLQLSEMSILIKLLYKISIITIIEMQINKVVINDSYKQSTNKSKK